MGQCWQDSYACPPTPGMGQSRARPGLLPSPLSPCEKTDHSPISLHVGLTTEPTGGGCCGSAEAVWEPQHMTTKAGPVLLVREPNPNQWGQEHCKPGSDPPQGTRQAPCRYHCPEPHWGGAGGRGPSGVLGQTDRLQQEPGLWGRAEVLSHPAG